MRESMRTCVRACVRVIMISFSCACLRVFERAARVLVCVRMYLRVCVSVFSPLRTFIFALVRVCVCASVRA